MISELGKPEEVFHGKIISVVHQKVLLPNGKNIIFESAERSPGVRILAHIDDNILMTKEWRKEINGWDYRLPGGKVFDTLDEYISFKNSNDDLISIARIAAQKELHEETGIDLDMSLFKHVHTSIVGATVSWDLLYFFVDASKIIDISSINRIETHEGEVTHPVWLKKSDVFNLCLEGSVQEDRSSAIIFRYIHNGFNL
jgi:8-oxo-dGTP pyrophosphatase MutT (NUDIX family)